jgi:predicted Zn finger-like uncharacterized protein
MIVECQKCSSKFNVNGSKIKKEGTKVKCSVCGNIFKVYPEQEDIPSEPITQKLPEEVETIPEMKEEKIEEVPLDEEAEEGLQEFQTISVDELSWKEDEKPLPEEVEVDESIEEVSEPEVGEEIVSEPTKGSRLPWIIGIVVIILIFVFGGAIIFFMPDMLPESLSFLKITKKEQVQDPGVALLSFAQVKGNFIQTSQGKQRFVIQGNVINRYPHPRSFIMVMGSILDSKGRTVRKLRVYAGNTFTEQELRTLSMREILKVTRNRFGRKRSNVNIRPGGRIPFMVVFEDLPEDMSEFAVEGISSVRGK